VLIVTEKQTNLFSTDTVLRSSCVTHCLFSRAPSKSINSEYCQPGTWATTHLWTRTAATTANKELVVYENLWVVSSDLLLSFSLLPPVYRSSQGVMRDKRTGKGSWLDCFVYYKLIFAFATVHGYEISIHPSCSSSRAKFICSWCVAQGES